MRTITGLVVVCLLLPFLSPGCSWAILLRIVRIEDASAVKASRFDMGEFCIEEGLLFDAHQLGVFHPGGNVIMCSMTVKNLSTFDVTIRSENFKFLLLGDGGSKESLETDCEIRIIEKGKILDTMTHKPFCGPVVLKPGEGIDLDFSSFLKDRKIPSPVRIQLLVSGITVGGKEVSFSVYAER
jgi:hypothetical protein